MIRALKLPPIHIGEQLPQAWADAIEEAPQVCETCGEVVEYRFGCAICGRLVCQRCVSYDDVLRCAKC